MKRLLPGGLSLLGIALAAWAAQPAASPDRAADVGVPAAFGGIHPRVSPEGKHIACSYQGAIWKLALDTRVLTRLTHGTGFDIEPTWSPDGKRIAYVNGPRAAGGELRLIDAASGAPIALPVPVQLVDTIAYSKLDFHPDGRLFGNFRVNGKDAGLSLLNPSTGEATPLAVPTKQSRYALSRDGRWLTYTASMDVDGQQWGNDGPQADLWKVSTAGSEPQKVTRFPSRIHDLCWSADGSELFVVSEAGGAHFDLWRMPVSDPARMRRITSGQADEDRPSTTADGRWLVYSDNRDGATALMLRDLHAGVDQAVTIARMDFAKPTGTLRLRVVDKATGKPAVARVSVRHADGKFIAPPGALHRVLEDYGHFYCNESAEYVVPAGKHHVKAFRGPEYQPTHADIEIAAGQTRDVTIEMDRWTNAAQRGWHSGENHIHANYGYGNWYNTPATMLDQCAGEDLRVCNFMVANSDTDGVFDREFFRGRPDSLSTPETILYWNQEFRSTLWGHMTLVNLSHVVEPVFTGFKDTTNPWDIPTNSDVADRTHLQQGLVNYTHSAQNPDDPYLGAYTGKGIPVDVALGKIDTLDLNASYAGTVPLWYRLLNCGFKLPPSAGTDVFLNRIRSRLPGGDRVYVKLDGEFSYAAWIDGLRAGRSFVTSGPMLDLSIEDKGPGDTVRLAAPRKVRIVAKAASQFPLNRVELVFNGRVAATGTLADDKLSGSINAEIDVPRSGWFSLRAAGPNHPDHTGGPLEAHASPIYIEVAGKPAASREDAEFFLKWIDRLSLAVRIRDRIPSPQLRQHVESQLEQARAVYARIAQSAE